MAPNFDYSIDSPIRYTADDDGTSGGTKRRVGHISSIWPITVPGSSGGKRLSTYEYTLAPAFLALEHFNSRNGVVIPQLPDIIQGCDFQMTIDFRDDQFNKALAIDMLMHALYPDPHTSTSNHYRPFAILGSLTSGVSQTMSVMADAFQIVQIAGTATSPSLDKSQYFTRTIPTNRGESAAIMAYLSQKNMSVNRIGILFVQDPYGEGFHQALIEEAHINNINVAISLPYQENNLSVETSMELLKASEVRYVILVSNVHYWKPLVRAAHKHGIMGGDKGMQWYMPEYRSSLQNHFALDMTSESDIAEALHGIGFIHLSIVVKDGFETAYQDFLLGKDDSGEQQLQPGDDRDFFRTTIGQTNSGSSMLQRFISSHLQPEVYNNTDQLPLYETSKYGYMMYDAVMALGIAACRTPGQFTTAELLHQLLLSEFPGASGWVALDRETGTRQVKDIQYEVVNFLISPSMSTNTSIRFESTTTALVQGSNITYLQDAAFVYADNTTVPPPDLPAIAAIEYNLIPIWALCIGWILCGLVLLASVACGTWTVLNRERHVVRVSQPLFLCQLCVGTFIMALAIVPLSMQEQLLDDGTLSSSKWNLDVACMAMPWLLYPGFALSLAAILAKTLRLNKLLRNSRGMKRIVVRYRDVLQPLLVLMGCNIVLLLACTLVAPFSWHRVPVENNVDSFGRSLESYGTCQHNRPEAPDTDMTTYYFMIPLRLINGAGVCVAAYQCYLARNLPTEMSESRYLCVSTISILEVSVISFPFFFLPAVTPTTYYLVMSSFISLSCFSILIPIFFPKYQQRNAGNGQAKRNNPVDIRSTWGGRGSRSHRSTVAELRISVNPQRQRFSATNSQQTDDLQAPENDESGTVGVAASVNSWGVMSVRRSNASLL